MMWGCSQKSNSTREQFVTYLENKRWGQLYDLGSDREHTLMGVSRNQYVDLCDELTAGFSFKAVKVQPKPDPEHKPYRANSLMTISCSSGQFGIFDLTLRFDKDRKWKPDIAYLPVFLNSLTGPDAGKRRQHLIDALKTAQISKYGLMIPRIEIDEKFVRAAG